MRAIANFQFPDFLDTLLSLLTAFAFGAAIGAERQYRQRTAGLRTNVLVSLGAAAFVDLAMRLKGVDGAVHVTAYVVSGVGFLGAGVILREGFNIRGLNTAATLWCSAAVGASAGADMIAHALLLTVFVVAGNTVLRPLVNWINRAPLDERTAEAAYDLRVTSESGETAHVREAVVELLDQAKYPAREITVQESAEETTELIATLVSTAVVPEELDAIVARIGRLAGVRHAAWEMRPGGA